MKRVGARQQATAKAIKSVAYDDARKNVATVRHALMDADAGGAVARSTGGARSPQAGECDVRRLHKRYGTQDENQQCILELE